MRVASIRPQFSSTILTCEAKNGAVVSTPVLARPAGRRPGAPRRCARRRPRPPARTALVRWDLDERTLAAEPHAAGARRPRSPSRPCRSKACLKPSRVARLPHETQPAAAQYSTRWRTLRLPAALLLGQFAEFLDGHAPTSSAGAAHASTRATAPSSVSRARHLVVEDRHRREAAGADAARRHEGHRPVRRRLAEAHAAAMLERPLDAVGALHVAGRARAQHERVAAGRLQPEEVVEGCHAVDLAERALEGARDVDQQVLLEVPEDALRRVQDLDQGVAAGLVRVDRAVEELEAVVAARVSGRAACGHGVHLSPRNISRGC